MAARDLRDHVGDRSLDAAKSQRLGERDSRVGFRDVARVRGPLVGWHHEDMRSKTKSNSTLPPNELRLVSRLQTKLKTRSKVEVVRRGLQPLRDVTEREALQKAYRRASRATRASLARELSELDHLAAEGLGES